MVSEISSVLVDIPNSNSPKTSAFVTNRNHGYHWYYSTTTTTTTPNAATTTNIIDITGDSIEMVLGIKYELLIKYYVN